MTKIIKKLSEEHKRKISNSLKGIVHTPECCRKLSIALKGKSLPLDTRTKMSIAKKGIKLSAKHRFNMRHPHKMYASRTRKPYVISGGRCYIYKPSRHPSTILKGKYISRYRAIVEHHIGRYLSKDEVVHHIDKNPMNDNFDNLLVCSRSEHSRMHRLKHK